MSISSDPAELLNLLCLMVSWTCDVVSYIVVRFTNVSVYLSVVLHVVCFIMMVNCSQNVMVLFCAFHCLVHVFSKCMCVLFV